MQLFIHVYLCLHTHTTCKDLSGLIKKEISHFKIKNIHFFAFLIFQLDYILKFVSLKSIFIFFYLSISLFSNIQVFHAELSKQENYHKLIQAYKNKIKRNI